MEYEPTSDEQIRQACPGIRTILYRDLATLHELPPLPLAILYETEPGFGHWVGLLETPEGIEHFDSYGLRPDSELRWIPKKYKAAFNSGSPHLVRLLLNDGRPVNFSEYRLQRGGGIATCGRWVVARCKNSTLTAQQFAKGMRGLAKEMGITPDTLTTLMMP